MTNGVTNQVGVPVTIELINHGNIGRKTQSRIKTVDLRDSPLVRYQTNAF